MTIIKPRITPDGRDIVTTTAREIQPGDQIVKTGRTIHFAKNIRVTRIEDNLLGSIVVYGTTTYTPTEAVVFRALGANVPVVVART